MECPLLLLASVEARSSKYVQVQHRETQNGSRRGGMHPELPFLELGPSLRDAPDAVCPSPDTHEERRLRNHRKSSSSNPLDLGPTPLLPLLPISARSPKGSSKNSRQS